MTASAIAISLITISFLNGLHNDALARQCDRPGVQVCIGAKGHWHDKENYVGCPCNPRDWPNDGPGAHDEPKNYDDSYDDSDDYFIGAK